MVQVLLRVAVALFLLWVILSLIGAVFNGLIHLLWIGILVVLAIWAWQYLARGQRNRSL